MVKITRLSDEFLKRLFFSGKTIVAFFFLLFLDSDFS